MRVLLEENMPHGLGGLFEGSLEGVTVGQVARIEACHAH
jgi:hypothetical protein